MAGSENWRVRVVFAALLFISSTLLSASDLSSLYDQNKLEGQRQRLHDDLDRVIAQEITPFLTEAQVRAFFQVPIDLPLTTPPDPDAFDFFSSPNGHITVPLLTIAFVEDLSEAYAWLWANGYSSQTVDEYMGMLRNHHPADFLGHCYPSPLTALHIPSDALKDPAVANMTQRVRSTTLSFILLHQFGHLTYRTAAEVAQLKHDPAEKGEELADAFALEVMKKNSETPAGLLMLIHGMIYLPSAEPKNHPLSDARLKAIADYLDLRVREFSEGRPDRRLAATAIHSLANHLRQAALFLNDSTGQQYWAEERRKTTVADLIPRHPSAL
jgi:hypothetical protein